MSTQARALGIDVLITDHHLPRRRAAAGDSASSIRMRRATRFRAGRSQASASRSIVMAALTREMQARGLHAGDAPVARSARPGGARHGRGSRAARCNNRVLVHRACGAFAPGAAAPASARCWKLRIGCQLQLTATDLGFQVGPRLNAAGRLDDMTIGIQCLLTDDLDTARGSPRGSTQLNQDRRELEAQMQQEALLAMRGHARRRSARCRTACACSTRPGIRAWSAWSRAA